MIIEIKPEHKIALKGRVNKRVYECLECDYKPQFYNVTPHVIGFNDFSPGLAWCIWECPKCGQVQRFHASKKLTQFFNYILQYEEYKSGNKNWLAESYRRANEIINLEK